MSRPSVILIGAGGHANACIDVIEQHGQFRIAGLIGTQEEMHMQRLGCTVIGSDKDLPNLAKDFQYAFIAVGQILSAGLRMQLYKHIVQLGFALPTIVAPSAYVSKHATIGAGTIVMHDAVVNAGAKVGKNCIINTRALIEHDTVVDDHCHISTGAILNGSVTVGAGTFVGSGSVIKDGISIGNNCVIGMGLSLRHDQADNSRYSGHKKS